MHHSICLCHAEREREREITPFSAHIGLISPRAILGEGEGVGEGAVGARHPECSKI